MKTYHIPLIIICVVLFGAVLASCAGAILNTSPLPTPTLTELPWDCGDDCADGGEVYRFDGTAPYTVTSLFLPTVYHWTDVITDPLVFNEDGEQRDWLWVQEYFGNVVVLRSPEPGAARLIAVYASTGPAVFVVHVQHPDGTPSGCHTVVRYWPGAPSLNDPGLEGCGGLNQGVYGSTNSEGDIGFGLGAGDYYWPDQGQVGASAIWVGRMPSDCITGLGMVGGTNHRVLFPVFEVP